MTNPQIDINESLQASTPIEELEYEKIQPRYRDVQMILTALGYLLLAATALFLLLLESFIWCVVAECVIAVALAVNLLILRKAWEFKGFALRESDISYRGGVVFPKTVTVPLCRLQQVSVKQNPVTKLFGLYALEVVNGAQSMAALTIPGLSEERANQIKGIVIQKLKNDNE